MFPITSSNASSLQGNAYFASNAAQSGSVSQATTALANKDEYYANWAEWVNNAPPGGGEQREQAVARMRECLENNMMTLDLSELNLSSLPGVFPPQTQDLYLSLNRLTVLPNDLPQNLINITARGNAFATLPDTLPENLLELNVEGNQLEVLPQTLPGKLKRLFLKDNQLTKLPENLPESLSILSVKENKVKELPRNLPKQLISLNASANELTEIPEGLPQSLTYLDVSVNEITKIPKDLPITLKELDASFNQLEQIEGEYLPPSLESVNLTNNKIENIAGNLPNNIRYLYLSANQLSYLPENLPQHLNRIELDRNHFHTLPSALLHYQHDVRIYVDCNPLSSHTFNELSSLNTTANSTGPRINFSMRDSQDNVAPRLLSESVKNWLPSEFQDDLVKKWVAIEKEENAAAFSAFLCRLGETKNVRENPLVKEKVTDWLSRLAEIPELREMTFAVAQDATTSCEDKVTYVWNEMQKMTLVHDVNNGVYDGKLRQLMFIGREMFRLEQLAQIARDKVKTLHFVDEIEVYLAYQTGLRDKLELTTTSEMMRFGDVSGVTQRDLDQALEQVRDSEEQTFPSWLAQWDPWKNALMRANPELVRNRQEEYKKEFTNKYSTKVNEALKSAGMLGLNIIDAEAAVGRKVQEDMERENDIALTTAFLQNHYQSLMTDESATQALNVLAEVAEFAAVMPSVAANIVRPNATDVEHISSRLAGVVAKGRVAPLAEAWVSLLSLLYKHNDLRAEAVISALLPHKKQDRVKSLAHAIAGAAWHSEAATKLCTLLTDVAESNDELRQAIIARLSLKQYGYGFKQYKLEEPADFYKRAKHADIFRENDAAKVKLLEAQLIPENRELYERASSAQAKGIDQKTALSLLARWIAVKGNWEGRFGDFAPNAIVNIEEKVMLNINIFDNKGEFMKTITMKHESSPVEKIIELNLQNGHYSPVINGEPVSVPADGDCFFYSFLTALNGEEPCGDDVQQLRHRLAEYIRHNEDIANFIDVKTLYITIMKQKPVIRQSDFSTLAKKINEEIMPQVLASLTEGDKDKADLERAKASANKTLYELKARRKKEKVKNSNEMVQAIAEQSVTQTLLYERSRGEKIRAGAARQVAKQQSQQRKIPSWKAPVSNASANQFQFNNKKKTTDSSGNQKTCFQLG